MRTVLVLTLIVLLGCDTPERDVLHGHLYFASGSYVGLFDLRDSSSTAVSSLGDVSIDHMSSFIGGDLLLTMRVYSNGRATSTILRYNTRTDEAFPLFTGAQAEYLPGGNAVVFDDGLTLWVTHRQAGYRDETAIDKHGPNIRPALVRVSQTEILFNSIVGDSVLIQKYDDESGTTQALGELSRICDLNAAIWSPDEQRLFCRKLGASGRSGAYHLVSLRGDVATPVSLPVDRNFRALAYLSDQKVLVLSEVSSGWGGGQPRNAVWIYDANTDKSYRIAKDQYLGDSVVYRP